MIHQNDTAGLYLLKSLNSLWNIVEILLLDEQDEMDEEEGS